MQAFVALPRLRTSAAAARSPPPLCSSCRVTVQKQTPKVQTFLKSPELKLGWMCVQSWKPEILPGSGCECSVPGRGEGPEVRMHLGHLRRRTLHYVPSLVPLATPEITVSCVHTKTWYNPSSLRTCTLQAPAAMCVQSWKPEILPGSGCECSVGVRVLRFACI